MDPYLEQRLRDEVIYLHSLWHQGPPNRRHSPTLHFQSPIAAAPHKRKPTTQFHTRNPPTRPDPRWETPPPPPSSSTWPPPKTASHLNPTPPAVEEKLRHVNLHARALQLSRSFFSTSSTATASDEEDSEDSDSEEDADSDVYKLLLNLFIEETELRRFYEGNWDGGEFYCLVCGGVGKTKKIKGCVGLVHHAMQISKTKKKRAHRAFAQVVCKVLGWEFRRLPLVVLSGEKLSFYLANPGVEQGALFRRNGDASNQCRDAVGKGKEDMEEEAADTTSAELGVNADELKSVTKDNVAGEIDGMVGNKENEAFGDHRCDDRKLMICQSWLKDEDTDNSRVRLDEGNIVPINKAIRGEEKDASGGSEVGADSREGDHGVIDYVATENDADPELGEKEVIDDHWTNVEKQMICQTSLNIDESNQKTETFDKGIKEVKPSKEDELVTGVVIEPKGAGDRNDLIDSEGNLDIVCESNVERGSKEEPGGDLVDGRPVASESQAEPDKHVDVPKDDLTIFLENLEPL